MFDLDGNCGCNGLVLPISIEASSLYEMEEEVTERYESGPSDPFAESFVRTVANLTSAMGDPTSAHPARLRLISSSLLYSPPG